MQPGLWLALVTQLAALYGNSALHQAHNPMVVQTNQMVKLSCEVNSKNTPIYWLRQLHNPTEYSQLEFLVSWNPNKGPTYGEGVTAEKLTVFPNVTQSILNLASTKPEDSGTYFCLTIGSPEMIFRMWIELRVVDVIPTIAKPTKKTTIKKKTCRPSNPITQKGPACGPITLSLLVAGILVLLVSLSVVIHLHCLRRKARIRFMKQFHKYKSPHC